jgi:hypothetical protein
MTFNRKSKIANQKLLRPSPSPLITSHGGGEKLSGVEYGNQFAPTLNDAAQDARVPGVAIERLNFVGKDFVDALGAINGERELLITAQRNDEAGCP